MAKKIPGYMIRKIYIIICDKCNEDITRPQGGDDVETLSDAEDLVREHQMTWHTDPDEHTQGGGAADEAAPPRQRPRTYAGPYCDSALAEYPPEPESYLSGMRAQDRPGWDELVREAQKR